MPTTTNPTLQAVTQTAHSVSQAGYSFYASNLWIFETVSVLLSAIFITAIVLIMLKTGWLRTRVDRVQDVILKANMPKKQAQDSWKKVQAHFFAGDDNDLKIAIVEADKMLEEALRHAGVRGASLGDRLKNLKKGQVPNLDNLWQAHKLRNQIAHETGFKIKRDVAERALAVYEEALQNLGALG